MGYNIGMNKGRGREVGRERDGLGGIPHSDVKNKFETMRPHTGGDRGSVFPENNA